MSTALANLRSDFDNLTTFPSSTHLKAIGLTAEQIAKAQRDYACNVAYTGALIGGGAAIGHHFLKSPLGTVLGALAGAVVNYGRHRVSLSL